MTSGDIGSIGLALAVVGAFFLAESSVLKKRAEVARETSSYWDGNPYLLRSAAYQAVEARVGFSLLFLGFFGQFLAYTGWLRDGVVRAPLLLGAGMLAFWLLLVLVVRRVSRWYSRRSVAARWGDAITKNLNNPELSAKHAELAEFYSIALDLNRESSESTEAYSARLIRSVDAWRK